MKIFSAGLFQKSKKGKNYRKQEITLYTQTCEKDILISVHTITFPSFSLLDSERFVRSFLLFCLLVVQAPFALAWQGVVDKVIDGDSLKIRQDDHIYDIRLYGVDSPELAQKNGMEARDAARKLVEGKSVDVHAVNVDQNGTTIAVIYVNDQYSLQAFLVGSGWTWVYNDHCRLKICKQWQQMEKQAKAAHLGLWTDPHPVPPWKWRMQRHTTVKSGTVRKAAARKRKAKAVRSANSQSALQPTVSNTPAPVESSALTKE